MLLLFSDRESAFERRVFIALVSPIAVSLRLPFSRTLDHYIRCERRNVDPF